MKQVLITHDCLKVEFPICFSIIPDIQIKQKINEHAYAHIFGVIKEDNQLEDILQLNFDTPVKIKSNLEDKVIFSGLITNMKLTHTETAYLLELDAASYSIQLDIKKRSRSFQNKKNLYKNLFKDIIEMEYGGQIIDIASKEQKQNHSIIQYEETDWEFIKRIASKIKTVVIPNIDGNGIQLYIGVPYKKTYKNLNNNFLVSKRIDDYLKCSKNYEQWNHLDFVTYYLESVYYYELGDRVIFNDIVFVIIEKCSQIIEGTFVHQYRLCRETAIKQNIQYNEKLQGLALDGKVIAIQSDKVKLHLCIDKLQDSNKAYWYPFNTQYCAEGNTGWYCMPQINDSVKLYMPTKREEDAFVRTVNRTENISNLKINNPEIKYFTTIDGKEMKFTPNELQFTVIQKRLNFTMHEEKGIFIKSNQEVKLISDKDICFYNNDLCINAVDTIELSSSQSKITVNEMICFESDGGINI